jgi:surface polysaccharide O-acyltransferase-like enzyme
MTASPPPIPAASTESASASGAVLPTSPRYPLLDGLRVLAMIDIVAIHVTGSYLFWGVGLPIFIITAVALSVRKPELPKLGEAARKRAARILLPWLVWTAFFALNRLFWAGVDPEREVGEFFYPWMLVAGTSVHLWFLPFIFVAELVVIAALRPLQRLPVGVIIAAAIGLALACVWITGRVYDATYVPGWGQPDQESTWAEHADFFGWTVRKSWLFGTASVCLGVALGRTLSLTHSARTRRGLLVGAAVLFALSFVWNAWQDGPIHGNAIWQWWRQAAAFFAVALAVQFTGKTSPRVMQLALLTMGIYLLHGWVHARLYHDLLPRLFHHEAAWDVLWPIGKVAYNFFGHIAIVWTLTALLVWWLRKTPLRRVL